MMDEGLIQEAAMDYLGGVTNAESIVDAICAAIKAYHEDLPNMKAREERYRAERALQYARDRHDEKEFYRKMHAQKHGYEFKPKPFEA